MNTTLTAAPPIIVHGTPLPLEPVPAGPPTTPPHVCVCVCTFRRPALLQRLLNSLDQPRGGVDSVGAAWSLSVVVVDNDEAATARPVVDWFRQRSDMPVVYAVEPERSFARVRNRAVAMAAGDFVAFLDDDEVPGPGWLDHLLTTQRHFGADGVLGPVRPYFDADPPAWVRRGRLCERPAHPTGTVLRWSQTRTGNVLLRRSLFDPRVPAFDPAYAAGGEDVDFFKRAMAAGRRFVWCEEAPAYELVPPPRWRVSYFLRRALLQGHVSFGYACNRPTPGARARVGAHALTALAFYALLLPLTPLGGFHVMMKVLIKGCHHLGRLRAAATVHAAAPRRDF